MTLSSQTNSETGDDATVNSAVYQRVKSHIIAGGIALGQRLDERTLAAQLGVSRTPVRDAISKLTVDGLVEHRPHQGSFVRTIDAKEIEDLYVVRANLESLAVRLAFTVPSDELLAVVRSQVEASEAALQAGDMSTYGSHDAQMHQTITRAANNSALTDALSRLEARIHLARNLANQQPGFAVAADEDRHNLLAALESGDIEGAAQAMREHIEHVGRAVLARLAQLPVTPALQPVGRRG